MAEEKLRIAPGGNDTGVRYRQALAKDLLAAISEYERKRRD